MLYRGCASSSRVLLLAFQWYEMGLSQLAKHENVTVLPFSTVCEVGCLIHVRLDGSSECGVTIESKKICVKSLIRLEACWTVWSHYVVTSHFHLNLLVPKRCKRGTKLMKLKLLSLLQWGAIPIYITSYKGGSTDDSPSLTTFRGNSMAAVTWSQTT